MSQLQRSAMSARLAKLPGYIPDVYTPTVAPDFVTEDDDVEEVEEAMSSIGHLPSLAPAKARKYVSDYTPMMWVTETSVQTRSATSPLSRFTGSERVHADLRREPLYASAIRLCRCRWAGFPRILHATCDEGERTGDSLGLPPWRWIFGFDFCVSRKGGDGIVQRRVWGSCI